VDINLSQIKTADNNQAVSSERGAQGIPETSFQKYLEEEQKRLGGLFSGWSQFNFAALFGYPDSTKIIDSRDLFNSFTSGSNNQVKLYKENQSAQPTTETPPTASANPLSVISQLNLSKTSQGILQEILAKTGWLVPNLQALPQFSLAQLDGILLEKMDLQFLVDQIVSQIKMVKDKGKTELTLGLKPENLGEIVLKLTAQGGLIYIQIQASEETRKIIQAQLNELEIALRRAHVNLGEVKILALKEATDNA